MELEILEGSFVMIRLRPDDVIPQWAATAEFVSATRTQQELSVVCSQEAVPEASTAERGFRCFRVKGPIDFSQIGVLSSLAEPLARAGISIFAISTYDTDYLFVLGEHLDAAARSLVREGHRVSEAR